MPGADVELSPRHIIGDHRSCAGSVASSDRGSGARRQSCGLGRSAGVGAVRRRERGGKPAAAEGTEAQRETENRGGGWIRSVRLRRHPRVADGRHRQHQHRLVRAVSRRNARRVQMRNSCVGVVPSIARYRVFRGAVAVHRAGGPSRGDGEAASREQRRPPSNQTPAGKAGRPRGERAGRAS